MEFRAAAGKYDRFMGRYTVELAPPLADLAGVGPGMTVCDVGCGPGGLSAELAARVGGDRVAAIDPAPQFVAACRARVAGADVREGVAEALPWPSDHFDATLSSLVIAFMRDAREGVREMGRVTRPGGRVAACMWDVAGGGMTMLATFWAAAREVDPNVTGERRRPGAAEGDLGDLFRGAGLLEVEEGELSASVGYSGFDDFWEPFEYAVGPAGTYLASLPERQRERVREACRELLPGGSFELTARAWSVRGTAPGA